MGWARVISGGPTGRYSIELDWGQSTRTTVLAALTARLAALDGRIVVAEANVLSADAQEATLLAEVTAQMDAYIAASIALPPGAPRPDSAGFKNAMLLLTKMRQFNSGMRLGLEKLKFERAVARERFTYWTNFNPVETRNAWCASLKEDKAPGSLVATLDIKGESDLIVIAPEARGWQPSDGVLTAREMMSPEQAFWNAAVLPGWQKFKPTYRWGTATSIDYAADTMNVTLGEARSSAQRLNVNQASTLAAVPVVYGLCNSKAFRVDDRVVVQFQGQDWTDPLVIGFLDNPRGCDWQCIGSSGVIPVYASTRLASADFLFDNWDSLDIFFKLPSVSASWINLKTASGDLSGETAAAIHPDITTKTTSHIHIARSYLTSDWSFDGDDAETRQVVAYIYRDGDDFVTGNPGFDLPPGYVCGLFLSVETFNNVPPLNEIAELRVMDGSTVVFNAAFRRTFPSGKWRLEVDSRSGITVLLVSDAMFFEQVRQLDGYTLYSEAP